MNEPTQSPEVLVIMEEAQTAAAQQYEASADLFQNLSDTEPGFPDPNMLVITEEQIHAVPEGFYPDTEDKVEWVLEQINDARAAITRIKGNSADRLRAKQTRLDYFLRAYAEPLREFAAANLPKKGKTLTLDHGKLAFVNVKAHIEITADDVEAVSLAEEVAPDLITIIPEQRKVNRTDLKRRMTLVIKEAEGDQPMIYRIIDENGAVVESDAINIIEETTRFDIR